MSARHMPVAAALLTYLVLGSLVCLKTPLWFAPDEELHVAYCQYIARNKALPGADITSQKERVIMAFHPPLYYFAGAFFFNAAAEPVENIVRINNGPGYALFAGGAETGSFARGVYRLRFFTLLCGVPIILAAYAAACMLFPHTVLPAAVAAFFVAANPQFLHVAAGISNEIPAAALCALVLLMLLAYCRRARSAGALLFAGCLLGLSLLTKTSAVFLVPLSMIVLLLAHRQPITRIVRDVIMLLGSAAFVSGWWYALNWKTLSALQTSQPWFNRRTPVSIDYLVDIGANTFISFFGFFGSHQIALPAAYLVFYGLIITAGICGGIKAVLGRRYNRQVIGPALMLAIAIAGGAAVFALLNYSYYAPQGKYLYTVIVPLAVLLGAGYTGLFPARLKAAAATLLIALMVIFAVLALQNVYMPSVREPRLRRIVAQPEFDCITPHITGAQPLVYSFRAPEDNLCGIRFLFSKTCSSAAGSLNIRVFQHAPAETEICAIDLPVRDIRDSHWHYFSFAPRADSAGKDYSVHIQARGLAPDARLSLWCASHTAAGYGREARLVPAAGCTPCFEAYVFTGTAPDSAWEGRETRAIRQTLYVSVREMQLFTQCGPGSANKAEISRKWHRLEQAATNRQNGCAEPPVGVD